MIVLNDELLIGRGYERACYRHPEDANLCVKVSEVPRITRKQQNPAEFSYYRKLAGRKIDWSHIARCLGWIETIRGPGLVFDFEHDPSGAPLPNLKSVLESRRVSAAELVPPLEELHSYLHSNRVIVCGLKPANIVCDWTPDGELKLIIVDGVKNDDYFKTAERVALLTHLKIDRIWHRFETKLARMM